MLTATLDGCRDALLRTTEGLTGPQLARRLTPSALTLGGLLHHLAHVEDAWFRVRFAGLPRHPLWAGAGRDDVFRAAAALAPEELRRRYEDACARSREVVAQLPDLDRPAAVTSGDAPPENLRWILLHMIEETARHNGHADLLRESVDSGGR
nr:DinB family protein [Geodermatophilus sabuli]